MIKVSRESAVSIPIILLFLLCSNLYGFKQSYWAVELPPFIFSFLVCCLVLVGLKGLAKQIPITLTDVIAAFFFFYSIFSSLVIAMPFPPSDRIFSILGCFLIYISVRITKPFSNESIQLLLNGLLFVIGCQAVYGILQFWLETNIVRGMFINPGIYGCFIGLGLPFITYLITQPKIDKTRIVLLIVIGILVVIALYLSRSRTACMSSLLGSMAIIIYRLKVKIIPIIAKNRITCTALPLMVFLGMMYLLWKQNTTSVSGRFLIWKISYSMFLDHPWFGIGYGNYFAEYGNYQASFFLSGKGTPDEIKMAGMNYYAFNEFLKIAVEQGVIGFLSFILLIIKVIHSAWRGIKNAQDYMVIFIVIIAVILLFGLFSYPFQDFAISALFYFCLAFVASIDTVLLKYTPSRLGKTVFLMVVCAFAFVSIERIYSIFQWRDATENLSEIHPSFDEFQQIYPVLSNNGAFLFNYAAELAFASQYEKAIPIFKRAARYGNSVELYVWLAECFTATGENVFAEQCFVKGTNMNPKLFKPFEHLLNFYQKTGQHDKARKIAEQICTKSIKIPSFEIDKIKAKALIYLQKDQL